MSVTYKSHLVLGFAIQRSQLLLQEAKRGCGHRETRDRFCGQCGAPMWAQEEQTQEILFQDRKFSVHEPNTTNFESGDGNLPVLVGVKVLESVSLKANTLETFVPVEEALRAELERMNIVPKGPFGVHLYRYVSY